MAISLVDGGPIDGATVRRASADRQGFVPDDTPCHAAAGGTRRDPSTWAGRLALLVRRNCARRDEAAGTPQGTPGKRSAMSPRQSGNRRVGRGLGIIAAITAVVASSATGAGAAPQAPAAGGAEYVVAFTGT